MKFLNRLLKTKKLDDKTIGSMWLCAANFDIHNFAKPNWCDVLVKEVGIKQVCMIQDGMFVESTERNPFISDYTVCFRGYVGRLVSNGECQIVNPFKIEEKEGWNAYINWVMSNGKYPSYFVGFFETKEDAENAYLDLVEKLTEDIASNIQKS